MNADQYTNALTKLVPLGKFWKDLTTLGADVYNMIKAISLEFERTDQQIKALVKENLPATSSELLANWEEFAGLRDTYTGVSGTQGERRSNAMDYFVSEEILTKVELIARAAANGYSITITEHAVLTCGALVCGQAIAQASQRFVVTVTILGIGGGARCGAMVCGDPIGGGNVDDIRNLVRRHILEHYEIKFVIP